MIGNGRNVRNGIEREHVEWTGRNFQRQVKKDTDGRKRHEEKKRRYLLPSRSFNKSSFSESLLSFGTFCLKSEKEKTSRYTEIAQNRKLINTFRTNRCCGITS